MPTLLLKKTEAERGQETCSRWQGLNEDLSSAKELLPFLYPALHPHMTRISISTSDCSHKARTENWRCPTVAPENLWSVLAGSPPTQPPWARYQAAHVPLLPKSSRAHQHSGVKPLGLVQHTGGPLKI